MKYRLKDRNRQREICFAYLNFDDLLQKICERDFHNDEDAIEFVATNVWTGIETTFQIAKTAIEEIPEFNPHSWNNYPDVEPPEGILMRIEEWDGTCCAGAFIDGSWHIDGRDMLGEVKRFRPWED